MLHSFSNRAMKRAGIVFFADDNSDDDDDDEPKGGGKDDDAAWQTLLDHFKSQKLTPTQVRSRFDNSRKWERQAKENKDAADKLAELEGANKSEVEKANEAKKAAEEKAAKQEIELLRLRIAARKGLTESQARRLVGDNEEELEADADELLQTFTPNTGNGDGSKEKQTPQRPRENLRPGSAPNAKPEELNPEKLAEMIPRGHF